MYFGNIVRKKDPIEEWVVTYNNSVFQSLRKKGDDTNEYGKVCVNEGPFEKFSIYNISTGRSLHTYYPEIYRKRINNKWYYSLHSGKESPYFYINGVGSILHLVKYDIDYSSLSDRARKKWSRCKEDYDNIFEFLRINFNQELLKCKRERLSLYLNAYGIYNDFDFNNYNYHKESKQFIKYILK